MIAPRDMARGTPKQMKELQTLRRRLAQLEADLKDDALGRQPELRRKVHRPLSFEQLLAKYDDLAAKIERLERDIKPTP